MSPRNTVQGIVHIMETTSCTRVLGDVATSSLIEDVRLELAAKGVETVARNLNGARNLGRSVQDLVAAGLKQFSQRR